MLDIRKKYVLIFLKITSQLKKKTPNDYLIIAEWIQFVLLPLIAIIYKEYCNFSSVKRYSSISVASAWRDYEYWMGNGHAVQNANHLLPHQT